MGRRLGSAAAWVGRHVAGLGLVGFSNLLPRRSEVATQPDDGRRPIVFVHGHGGQPGNFYPMRAWLRWQGRRRTWAAPLLGEPSSIEAMAERLAVFVARVSAGCGGEAVDIVAHSMGGVIARLTLDDPATAARVSTLVTLGAPHAGTVLARFAWDDLARALRPGSQVLARLERQLPWRGPRLVCFWSRDDLMVQPPESACVPGAENIELPGFTHYGYLLHPECWRRVGTVLGT